jgi:hypothetical protein
MVLSYSGIVNYGKVTLPSVNSWNTSMNIVRDPPKSIHTRKIDKVGETPAITSLIDESGDRFCEAINYYPRGQNPMVSVSYGEGQTSATTSNRGNAFLPYRVVRDGAFRPPVMRQEDLLPLSRMPRIWTNMSTQPYSPIFTMRIKNCGTVENTKEVKNDMLNMSCISNRAISAYPSINAPDTKSTIIRDPLVPGEVNAAMSCSNTTTDYSQRIHQKPLLLAPTRVSTSGFTNPHMIKETLLSVGRMQIENKMNPNHPVASATTNFAAGSMSGYNPLSLHHPSYDRLPTHTSKGGFDTYQSRPEMAMDHQLKSLVRVR